MDTHVYTIQLDKPSRLVHIEPLGDLHIGSRSCDKKKMFEVRDRIKNDKWIYTIVMGDITDAIFPHPLEARFSMDVLDPEFFLPPSEDDDLTEYGIGIIDYQYEYARKLLDPIKDKIIALHSGNHDWKLVKYHHRDWARSLANNLGVKYAKGMCMTRVRFTCKDKLLWSIVINSHHGSFGGQTDGGNLTKLVQLMTGWEADLYLRGHSHRLFDAKRIRKYVDEEGNLVDKTIILASVGSFTDTYKMGYTSYGEERDYLPLRVGTTTITVNPLEKKIYSHT